MAGFFYDQNGNYHSFVDRDGIFNVFKISGLTSGLISNSGTILSMLSSTNSNTAVLEVPQGQAAPNAGQHFGSETFEDSSGRLTDDKAYGANGVETDTSYDQSGMSSAQSLYTADGTLIVSATISHFESGQTEYDYTAGSALLGKAYSTFQNTYRPYGSLLHQTESNADGSIYLDFAVSKLSNGNLEFNATTGSYFHSLSYAGLDQIVSPTYQLLSETFDNANGSAYQQITVSLDASTGHTTYHSEGGSFFTGKSFSAYDNVAGLYGALLEQILTNTNNTHSFTVPGSGLALTAAKNDTFNVTGSNETIRFGATGFGADTFNGYKAGDVFSFATSVFADYATLSSHVSGTTSAVITDTTGDTLTLAGVAKSSLTSSMFKFV